MYCTNCGKQIERLSPCDSTIRLPLQHSRFDSKTGKRWFRQKLGESAKCDRRGHKCDSDDLKLKLRRIKGYALSSDMFLDPLVDSEDRVNLGPCGNECCPHCGSTQRVRRESRATPPSERDPQVGCTALLLVLVTSIPMTCFIISYASSLIH